jgi:hypothetical protein
MEPKVISYHWIQITLPVGLKTPCTSIVYCCYRTCVVWIAAVVGVVGTGQCTEFGLACAALLWWFGFFSSFSFVHA